MTGQHRFRIQLFTFLLSSAACILATPAAPQMNTVLGIVGGGALLNEAGEEFEEAINHAQAAAESILGLADAIAAERLDQIDRILSETVDGLIGKSEQAALELLNQATQNVNDLEQQIISDLKAVIWEAECAGKRVALEDAREALGGLADFLNSHQIKLTPAKRVRPTPKWYSGCFWSCDDPYTVEITEPFGETFIKVRDLMEESIAATEVSDDTPAYDIVGTYEFLSAFALKTSCFYPGSSDAWNLKYIEYRSRAQEWRNVTTIEAK